MCISGSHMWSAQVISVKCRLCVLATRWHWLCATPAPSIRVTETVQVRKPAKWFQLTPYGYMTLDQFWTIGLVMEMANPLLESFREPPKTHVANSSHPPANLKGKGNPDLPSVCSNHWASYCGSVCVLTFWYVLSNFRQCKSAVPHQKWCLFLSWHL